MLLAASLVAALAVAEAVCRHLYAERFAIVTDERNLLYAFDPALGWFPRPSTGSRFLGERSIEVRHNSLGLRDIEIGAAGNKTILFLGDSFVWGYDVDIGDRFTERLRRDLPQHRIVNAGIAGYGTDQEFLLLQRLWERVKPDIIVVMFCVDNDRRDNSTNSRYDGHYKPYLELTPDGGAQFRGQPVPKSRHVYFIENPLAHHSWLARVAVSAFVQLRHPPLQVADPTERLVGMMRDFVHARGARFMVGLQHEEPQLQSFLTAQKIPHTSFDGADHYLGDGDHWTPKGHDFVAARLTALLAEIGVTP